MPQMSQLLTRLLPKDALVSLLEELVPLPQASESSCCCDQESPAVSQISFTVPVIHGPCSPGLPSVTRSGLLRSVWDVPGPVLGTEDMFVTKMGRNPCLHGASILMGDSRHPAHKQHACSDSPTPSPVETQ